jgi:uncharacterized integral membrane protein (TIGR00698 family)
VKKASDTATKQGSTTHAPAEGEGSPAVRSLARTVIFVAVGLAVTLPWRFSSPQLALGAGIVLALAGLTAFESESRKLSSRLIQLCVVLLGLRSDLRDLVHELGNGALLAVFTVVGTLGVGLVLGRLLRTGRGVSLLVSSGTSICGGSAIAAIGLSIEADSSSMAVATAAIFVLNAIGLFALPALGHVFGMTDVQFGTWAGIALHDIASVAGAGKAFNPGSSAALETAMVVKLARVLWITPVALMARWWWTRGRAGEGGSAQFPWFVLLFIAASGVRTLAPAVVESSSTILAGSGLGFQLALFLIGAGLSRKALQTVGWRALAQALLLWIFIASASLVAVRITGPACSAGSPAISYEAGSALEPEKTVQ